MFSYWEKTAFLHMRTILIIGSGLVGLRTALVCKQWMPDADILILERGFLPSGASTRNAGFACFGSVTELMDDISRVGEQATFDLVEARYRGLEILRNELGDHEIGFQMSGGYEIFTDADEFEKAVLHIADVNKRMYPITGEPQLFQPTTYEGFHAIHTKLEGYLHSGKLVRKLMKLALKAGITIWNSAKVASVTSQQVVLESGLVLEAEAVVVTTNAFASQLVPKVSITPARGYIFVTEPMEHNWKGTFHYDKGYIYFRDLGNRMLIGGGRNADFEGEKTTDLAINPNIKTYLQDFARNTLGLGNTMKVAQEWSGIMGFGESKMPTVARTEEGIFVAAGLGGMGVALGMETGSRVAKLMYETLK